MFTERAQSPPFAWQAVCRAAEAFKRLGCPSVSGSGDHARLFKSPCLLRDGYRWSSGMFLMETADLLKTEDDLFP
jgi:hypothetical protein